MANAVIEGRQGEAADVESEMTETEEVTDMEQVVANEEAEEVKE